MASDGSLSTVSIKSLAPHFSSLAMWMIRTAEPGNEETSPMRQKSCSRACVCCAVLFTAPATGATAALMFITVSPVCGPPPFVVAPKRIVAETPALGSNQQPSS